MAKRDEIYSIPEKYLILSSSSHDGPSESPLEPFQNFLKNHFVGLEYRVHKKKKFFFPPTNVLFAADRSHFLGFFHVKTLLRILRRLSDPMAVLP